MAEIVVLGAGICGLAAAMMLARDGHELVLLERDAAPPAGPPAGAWEDWGRGGVAQFRQAHYLQPRGREVLDEELPGVCDAVRAAGAPAFSAVALLAPSIADRAPRAGDERFATVAARRPLLEHVLARAAEGEPRVEIRRGVTVEELLARRVDGVAHVGGVRTGDGGELRADLVVDAMGRRSPLPRLLDDAGAGPVHEESEDAGFIYYTRFFRGSQMPAFRAAPLTPLGTITVLTLPADNGTWSVTIFISAGDRPLKRLRDADRFDAVLGALPRHAQWLDGEPISDVMPIGGTLDRLRRLHGDGRPAATGVALLADACALTNPSSARGMALGLVHAQRLRAVVRDHLGDGPRAFADAWDADTERELVPWYRATVRDDRDRLLQIEALRQGRTPPPPADRAAAVRALLPLAASRDPDIFRVFLTQRACIGEPDALQELQVAERILELTSDGPPPPFPGPDREGLLALLG